MCPSGEDGEVAALPSIDITDLVYDVDEEAAVKRKRDADTLNEEEQLRLAIENSLRESNAGQTSNDSASASGSGVSAQNGIARKRKTNADIFETLEFDSDSDGDTESTQSSQKTTENVAEAAAATSTDYKDFLGPSSDPTTRLQLRLPDGQRDNLEWPCSSQIQALRTYVEHRYPEVTRQPYKIICAFPRQDLLALDATETLLSAKLHPNALLHLHQDD